MTEVYQVCKEGDTGEEYAKEDDEWKGFEENGEDCVKE